MDSVDLPIHETGHSCSRPFGEFVQFLGGTLFQLIMPSVFVGYFLRRKDRHAASVALWWVAQNFWNISVYIRDARAQELPLVGGGEHDWAYLLGRLGWLTRDQVIGHARVGDRRAALPRRDRRRPRRADRRARRARRVRRGGRGLVRPAALSSLLFRSSFTPNMERWTDVAFRILALALDRSNAERASHCRWTVVHAARHAEAVRVSYRHPWSGVRPDDSAGVGGHPRDVRRFAIVLGLFTRPIAFLLAGEMAVAYFTAHFPRSIYPVVNQGEPAVLYCFIYLYLMFAGAGPWSIDAMISQSKPADATSDADRQRLDAAA